MPTFRRVAAGTASLLFGTVIAAALPPASEQGPRDVTILYTTDLHSAFDPIPAYWLPGSPRLGGAAQLAGLVRDIRRREKTVFLFDAGDMFTGMLSNVTRGEALMEMMLTMSYDAMTIGNHEFDYGSENFTRQMHRVPFPVLPANVFYKGTKRYYSRPYAILERNGVIVGVIGIIGQDARSVALPSGITDLEFVDPIPAVRAAVRELKPSVDLLVVLAHPGQDRSPADRRRSPSRSPARLRRRHPALRARWRGSTFSSSATLTAASKHPMSTRRRER